MDKPKFKINDKYESPENRDYDILGFHKKRTIIGGELRVIEYYKNYDGITYSDLVLKETREFSRNNIGLIQYRILTIEWYLEDDTVGCKKVTKKFYSPQESIDEGITRRSNVIAEAKLAALSTVGQMQGFDLMASLKNEIDLFINGYTQPLKDAVTNSTKPYLNPTIKQTIVTVLTF